MRLRECRNCGRRLTTYETAAAADRDLAQLGALTRKQVEKLMARLIEMVGWPL